MPLVSIIMPVYNLERFVEQAIRSVLAQSYVDFELIIVDDASTDKTYSIAEALSKEDHRIILVRLLRNLKICGALNEGLRVATGSLIARFDGDDIMPSDRLATQIDFLSRNPSVSLVGCSYNYISESGEFLGAVRAPTGVRLVKRLLPYCNPVAHNWLATREVYLAVGAYRFPSVEDYDFLCRASKLGFKIDNVPDYVGNFLRIRKGNTVDSIGLSQSRLWLYVRNGHFGGRRLDQDTASRILECRDIFWRLNRLSDLLIYSSRRHFALRPLKLFAPMLSPIKCLLIFLRIWAQAVIFFDKSLSRNVEK